MKKFLKKFLYPASLARAWSFVYQYAIQHYKGTERVATATSLFVLFNEAHVLFNKVTNIRRVSGQGVINTLNKQNKKQRL